MKNREDAEEITQDVFFKVCRGISSFQGDAALSSWIYRITFNAAMSRVRTVQFQRAQGEERQTASTTVDDVSRQGMHDPADWSQLADERVLRSQLRRRLFGAIPALPAILPGPRHASRYPGRCRPKRRARFSGSKIRHLSLVCTAAA